MTIQERILQVLSYKGITPYRLCKDLGFSRGYLEKRGSIGTDKYLKIIEYLPEVNPDWLLSGEGEMFKKGKTPPEPIESPRRKADTPPPMQTEEPATVYAVAPPAPSFVGEFLSMIREKDTQIQELIKQMQEQNKQIQDLLVKNAELKAEIKHLWEQHRAKDYDAGSAPASAHAG